MLLADIEAVLITSISITFVGILLLITFNIYTFSWHLSPNIMNPCIEFIIGKALLITY